MKDSTLRLVIAIQAELEERYSDDDDFYHITITKNYITVSFNGQTMDAQRGTPETAEQLGLILQSIRELKCETTS